MSDSDTEIFTGVKRYDSEQEFLYEKSIHFLVDKNGIAANLETPTEVHIYISETYKYLEKQDELIFSFLLCNHTTHNRETKYSNMKSNVIN